MSFLGQILVYAYNICQHGQILISFAIPTESVFLLSHAYPCIPFVPGCCIHLFDFQLTVLHKVFAQHLQ